MQKRDDCIDLERLPCTPEGQAWRFLLNEFGERERCPPWRASSLGHPEQVRMEFVSSGMDRGSSRAAASASQGRHGADQAHMRMPPSLSPPLNFGIVQANVYRSNVPTAPNFEFLRQLNLKVRGGARGRACSPVARGGAGRGRAGCSARTGPCGRPAQTPRPPYNRPSCTCHRT